MWAKAIAGLVWPSHCVLFESTAGPAPGFLLPQCSQGGQGWLGLPALVTAEIPGGCRDVMGALCWACLQGHLCVSCWLLHTDVAGPVPRQLCLPARVCVFVVGPWLSAISVPRTHSLPGQSWAQHSVQLPSLS